MLEYMGWKDRRNNWIWSEIILDVSVIVSGISIITILAYAYL